MTKKKNTKSRPSPKPSWTPPGRRGQKLPTKKKTMGQEVKTHGREKKKRDRAQISNAIGECHGWKEGPS